MFRLAWNTEEGERDSNLFIVSLGLTALSAILLIIGLSTASLELDDYGLAVPAIVDVDGPRGVVLQEDLGDRTLQEALKEVSAARHEELYREAIKLYRAGNWELAELQFVNLAKRAPKRPLYKLYIERINGYRTNPPPPDWDGVYTHLEK